MAKVHTLNFKEEKNQILLESESKKNLQKVVLYHNTQKNKIYPIFSKILHLIVFEFILLLLPKMILLDNYTEYIQVTYRDGNISKYIPSSSINDVYKQEIVSVLIYNLTNFPMNNMFSNFINLKSVSYEIYCKGQFNIGNMEGIFSGCSSLESFTLTDVYSSHKNDAIKMTNMFYRCQNLISVTFNNELKVSDINHMFDSCSSLVSVDLSKLKSDDSLDLTDTFINCRNLKSITFGSFKVGNMTNIELNSNVIEYIDLSKMRSDDEIDMSGLFNGYRNLKTVEGDFKNIFVGNTNEMFYNCYSLTSISFKPEKINSNINMTKMFYNCSSIQTIELSTKGGSTQLTPVDMSEMFYNCVNLMRLSISNFKTDKLNNMTYML